MGASLIIFFTASIKLCFITCCQTPLVFGPQEVAWVAFVKKDQGLPLCLTEGVLARSITDALLVKAEPISEAGSASVINIFKKG